jgi:hypothetical protein
MIRAGLILLLLAAPAHADVLNDAKAWLFPTYTNQAQAAQDSPAAPAMAPDSAPVPAALPAASPARRDLTLPDHELTPGVTVKLTVKQICAKKWGKDARAVTAAMKRQVFESYGLSGNDDESCTPDQHGRHCEVDHLISRELGGADDVKNLWPQPYGSQPWNAVRKDRVENRLHKEVCAGNITLEQAQKEIAEDYRVPYRRYFGEPK